MTGRDTPPTSERDAVCWLHRRAGFGLAHDDLSAAVARGVDAEIDSLTGAGAVARAVAADPWNDADLPITPKDRAAALQAIATWIQHMTETDTPLVDRMAWTWHGHFVSALDKVKVARLMVDQIRLFRQGGLGSFADLLRAVTTNPAMLIYLDGNDSTGAHPNENYGREVLELFTVGLGGYTEADVQAGAAALTGWRARRGQADAELVARRHDDTARTYLGVDGVHDVPTVVGAIMQHPALASAIAGFVAGQLLGTTADDVVAPLASAFAAADFDVAELVRATLRAGLSGASQPLVLAPVPWLVIAQRVTGAQVSARVALTELRTAGQVPMMPPNVAGWPGGAAWFGTSTVVARANLAAAVASAAPADNDARVATDHVDMSALADALGLPMAGFGEASTAALLSAAPGVERLALALCTPEFVIA